MSQVKPLFITGTGTDVGKTVVTLALMRALQAQGLKVQGMKPVAAGAQMVQGVLANQDALRLCQQSSHPMALERHNPYLFEAAIAPHLAARRENRLIKFDQIGHALMELAADSDTTLVEGAGGFLVPLGEEGDWGDFCQHLSLPVILVVGMELGCINHALLTEEAILGRSLNCLGWIANTVDPQMMARDENLETLIGKLRSPFLGQVDYASHWEQARFLPTPLFSKVFSDF